MLNQEKNLKRTSSCERRKEHTNKQTNKQAATAATATSKNRKKRTTHHSQQQQQQWPGAVTTQNISTNVIRQNISTNIWSLGKRTGLKLGEVSSLFIFYNITISWPFHRMGFDLFFYCVTVKSVYCSISVEKNVTFILGDQLWYVIYDSSPWRVKCYMLKPWPRKGKGLIRHIVGQIFCYNIIWEFCVRGVIF